MRQPRFDDFTEWRRIRLRDQWLIEPFWVTSPLDWASRHSKQCWAHEWLEHRDGARAGRSLSLVIEVDGRLAGQFDLGSIDENTRSAEVGIWVDAEVAHRGVGALSTTMMLDFAFETLEMERVTAPISPDNVPASRGAASVGLVREALMADYFDVGRRRQDHALWAVTRDAIPPNGFRDNWLERFSPLEVHAHVDAKTDGPPSRSPMGPVPKSALLNAIIRYHGRRYCRRFHRLGFGRPVTLASAGTLVVLLRSPRLGDYVALQKFNGGHGILHDESISMLAEIRRSPVRLFGEFMRGRRGFRAAGGLRFVVDLEGRFVGECGLSHLDMFDGNARMYVSVASGEAASRIATAAMRRLLDYAFGPLRLVRVSMVIDPKDDFTADTAARAGMAREGTLHGYLGPDGRRGDHELWAATARMAAKR